MADAAPQIVVLGDGRDLGELRSSSLLPLPFKHSSNGTSAALSFAPFETSADDGVSAAWQQAGEGTRVVVLLVVRPGDESSDLTTWIGRCRKTLGEVSRTLGRRYDAMERYFVVVDTTDTVGPQLAASAQELRDLFPCGRFYMGKYLEDQRHSSVAAEHVWIPALQGFCESLIALPDNFRLSAFRAADFYSWRAVRFTFVTDAHVPATGAAGEDGLDHLLGGLLNTPSLTVQIPTQEFAHPPVGMSWHEIGWPLFVETEADVAKLEGAEPLASVARPLAMLTMDPVAGHVSWARKTTQQALSHLARNPQNAASAVAALNAYVSPSPDQGFDPGVLSAAVLKRDKSALQLSEAALGMQASQSYFLHFFLRWFAGLLAGLVLFWASLRLLRPLVGDFDTLRDWSLRFVAMRPVMDLAIAALAAAVLAALCVHFMESERGRRADKALRKLWQDFVQSVRDVQKAKATVLQSAHRATADLVLDLMRAKVWRFAHRLAGMFSTVLARGRLDATEKLSSAVSTADPKAQGAALDFLSQSCESKILPQQPENEAGTSSDILQTIELVWDRLRSVAKTPDGTRPPLAMRIEEASAALSWQLLEVANTRETARAESEPGLATRHAEWLLQSQHEFIRAPRPELQSCRLPDEATYEAASDPSGIAPRVLVVAGRICQQASELAARGGMVEMPTGAAQRLAGRGFAFWLACFGIHFRPGGEVELAKSGRIQA